MTLKFYEKKRYRQKLIDNGFDFGPFVTGFSAELREVERLHRELSEEEFNDLVSWSDYSEIRSNRSSRALSEKTKGMKGRNFISRRFQQEITAYEKLTSAFNLTGDDIEGEGDFSDVLAEIGDLEIYIRTNTSNAPQALVNSRDHYEETGEEKTVHDSTNPADIYPLDPAKIIGNGYDRIEFEMVLEEILECAKLTDHQKYYLREVIKNPGVTYREIGEELGMTKQSVQNWLKPSTIKKVASYITKIGVEDLFGIDETEEIKEMLNNAKA